MSEQVANDSSEKNSSEKDYSAHESSFVDDGAEVGSGTRIWHFCHVMPGASIGRNCNIGQNVCVSAGVRVGDNVKIQNNVSLYSGVVLEDDVFLGPSMVFTNVFNPRSHVSRRDQYLQTLVKRGATIGANATIVCGITLGRYAFIGAGAVVTRDVPDHALVHGNPARIHGWMCQCGEKLSFVASKDDAGGKETETATCARCSSRYIKRGEEIEAA